MELVFVYLLTIICFPVITLSDGILRIILGSIFLLIFPGYTMIAALFPNKNSLTGIERAGLTLVMSFALITLAGLALNYTPWGIRLTPIYIAMSIIIVVASAVALLRRAGMPEAERFSLNVKFRMPKRGNTSKLDTALSICLVIVVIGAVYALAYMMAHPKAQEPFSNFYVLGAEDMMENYPRELTLGEPTVVTLGIDNYENQETRYNIEVSFNGTAMQSIGPVLLANEGKWSNEVTLIPPKAGDNQRVEFLLYKGEEPAPYLTLHLWLNVKE
jgi:uncharacterized membrane protein